MNYCCFFRRQTLTTISLFLLTVNSVAFAKDAVIISQQQIAQALTPYAKNYQFPSTLELQDQFGNTRHGKVEYTFDSEIHQDMTDLYLRYQPDYACFVAMDADTGAILNLSSFIKADERWDNLVLRADYPAASVFKIITASAGVDLGKVDLASVIPFNGKSTTLYKNQVLNHKKTKWTRNMSLKEAFAKSANPVFGRLAAQYIGKDNLLDYARRFAFDQPLHSDFILPQSQIRLSLDTQWALAEAGSGFTKEITLSPVHAAQMAAVIVNGGKLVIPHMVKSVRDTNGQLLYLQQVQAMPQLIKSSTAKSLRSMMYATTRIGSGRKSFRGVDRYPIYKQISYGGKTGSLTGFSPKGKHDWFVGFAEKDGRRIAFASLIINKEKWYVRSSYIGRQFIYNYFSE